MRVSDATGTRRPGERAAGQARTRRTHAAVVDAARALFLERGYAATTVAAISTLSDTPQATVYRLFSSKLGILKSLLDVSIGGDDQPLAVADRPRVRAILKNPDPNGQVAAFASLLRNLLARTVPVHRILADAARSDEDAASVLAEISGQRQAGQRRIARSLTRSGALRPGLRERDAADVIHALASPEVYGLLVLDRRWSGERYETWLREILADQLLRPRSGAGGDRNRLDQNAQSTERKRKT
jgi:AcrR family transcriptional regulator